MSQAGASKGGKMRLAVDGAGFYDLMVAVDNDAVFGDGKQAEMANFLIRLGYDAVAYNVSAAAPLAKQHRCQIKACPTEHAGAPAAPDRKKRPAPAALRIDTKPAFQQLTRLTVAVEDATHVHAVDISNEVAGTYDLLAVRPLSERVFELACKSMRVDIISLDLSRRLPFYLKVPVCARRRVAHRSTRTRNSPPRSNRYR
jgi:ribonuclease P/MRP protein subunit RPP1